MSEPAGFEPKGSILLPSWRSTTTEVYAHVPTSWALEIFVWAIEAPDSSPVTRHSSAAVAAVSKRDRPTTRRDEASAVSRPVTEATRANSSADRARRSRTSRCATQLHQHLLSLALARFTLIRSCASHGPKHRDVGIIDSPHANVNVLPRIRGVGPSRATASSRIRCPSG